MIRSFFHPPDGALEVIEGIADFDKLVAIPGGVLWVDLCKPTDEESYVLTHDFHFHPLAIEDVMTEKTRTKLDDYEDYLFGVFPVVDFIGREEGIRISELDFFLGSNSLVTVRHDEHRIFDFLYERVDRDERLIGRGADHMLHAILDAVVDNHNTVLDIFEYEVDQIEDDVLGEADQETLSAIFALRRDIVHFKRIVIPQRDVVQQLYRQPHSQISEGIKVYLADILDHLARVNEMADSHREIVNSSLEIYYSAVSTKTNQVIKFLTVMTAIFIPPTFLVGLWGMNFAGMPELNWEYGYIASLSVMAVVMAGMVLFFRKKKWF